MRISAYFTPEPGDAIVVDLVVSDRHPVVRFGGLNIFLTPDQFDQLKAAVNSLMAVEA